MRALVKMIVFAGWRNRSKTNALWEFLPKGVCFVAWVDIIFCFP